MQPIRLRILLPDEPGRLGQAATALSKLGINILDVDVQSHDGRLWADDLIVDTTVPLDPTTIDHALRDAGVELVDLADADPHELVDSTVRCLELVQAMAPGGELNDHRLVIAARGLVRAELAWVVPGRTLHPSLQRFVAPDGVAAEAMSTRAEVQRRELVISLPSGPRGAWTLAVPFDDGHHRRVLAVARRSSPFSYTETGRVRALLRLAMSLASSRSTRLTRGAPNR